MKFFLSIFVILLLLGCAGKYDVVLPDNSFEKIFYIHYGDEKYFLSISKVDKVIKFGLFNAVGIPMAKKIFKENKLKNDGFLPPNKFYDKLFIKFINPEIINKNNILITVENKKIKAILLNETIH